MSSVKTCINKFFLIINIYIAEQKYISLIKKKSNQSKVILLKKNIYIALAYYIKKEYCGPPLHQCLIDNL